MHKTKAYIIPAEHEARPIGAHDDASIDLATYAQEICAIHWPDRNRGESEVKANARLIAAAPELLEACQSICGVFEGQEDVPRYVAKARAAIAKATQ